jgi:gliding motility-associated-like protein
VPTGFAPNYANVGNLLKPYGGATNISSITFKVYNRYGNLVFESNNVSDGWDGRINGAVQESGAYVWYLDYTFNSGQQKHSKGTCVLIR